MEKSYNSVSPTEIVIIITQITHNFYSYFFQVVKNCMHNKIRSMFLGTIQVDFTLIKSMFFCSNSRTVKKQIEMTL